VNETFRTLGNGGEIVETGGGGRKKRGGLKGASCAQALGWQKKKASSQDIPREKKGNALSSRQKVPSTLVKKQRGEARWLAERKGGKKRHLGAGKKVSSSRMKIRSVDLAVSKKGKREFRWQNPEKKLHGFDVKEGHPAAAG